MAFLSIPNVRIAGLAAAVPKEKKDILNLKCFAPGEAEKVMALTGITESRLAPEGMVCSDYCQFASERLIEELGWEKDSIDALVYLSVSRDYIEPNTSTVIQGRMGLPSSCYTIDVPMACSGYCYGLSVVASLLSLGCMKRALMLVGDTPSKIMSDLDKTVWPLHGDAGTATALEFCQGASPMLMNLLSDGSQKDAIISPHSGVRNPITEVSLKMEYIDEGIIRNKTHVTMDGISVFAFATMRVPKDILALIDHFGLNKDSIDYLLLHQANKYIDDKIRKKLKFTEEKTPYCLDEFGNTSSGTIPMTMVTRIREDLEGKKNKLLLSGFGAGLSWAAVYLETDPFRVLPLIEV
ncbi:MAG: ketoacyl-ACP synthase III [Bacteroidales bacterium]|nr:ketoacyl-ACP synthase III [Bacteroidales bacterium]